MVPRLLFGLHTEVVFINGSCSDRRGPQLPNGARWGMFANSTSSDLKPAWVVWAQANHPPVLAMIYNVHMKWTTALRFSHAGAVDVQDSGWAEGGESVPQGGPRPALHGGAGKPQGKEEWAGGEGEAADQGLRTGWAGWVVLTAEAGCVLQWMKWKQDGAERPLSLQIGSARHEKSSLPN